MSADGLNRFHAVVLNDRALQDVLMATAGRAAFVALVVERAGALGLDVGAADVEAGLRESRAAWVRRWI